MNKRKFTPEETELIRQRYPTTFTAELAKELGRAECSIWGKAQRMGIKKCPEWLKQNCRIQPGQSIAPEHQFKKGLTPFNKGKKLNEFMSAEGIANSAKTRFRKGQQPHNTRADFEISTRAKRRTGETYKFIRIAAGKWELYHRYLWEQSNGPIPPKMVLTFLNGDTLDCRLENLKLITMAENAMRNSASLNLTDGYVAKCLAWHRKEDRENLLNNHPELIKTAKLNYQLNRKIKSHAK